VRLINLPTIELIKIPENTEIISAPLDSAIWSEFLALQISPATRRSYAASLKDFFRRKFSLAVSPQAIAYFLACSESDALGHVLVYRGQLLDAGLAAGTINARLAALKSFVNHAARRKLCDFRLNDIRAVKAQTYKDTRGVSIDQFQDLIDSLDRANPLGCRNYAILRLLWDNGLRRGEVCGLDRADFRAGEARLLLRGKGRIDKEPLDLAPVTVAAIADWLTVAADWQSMRGLDQADSALFLSSRNTRLSASQLYKMVRELAAAADSIERVLSPHRVRHSSITALLDLNGGNLRAAQAHSRHKDVSTLIRYDDNRQELQGKSARTLADAID
jgi:integrase/recombinase XerC